MSLSPNDELEEGACPARWCTSRSRRTTRGEAQTFWGALFGWQFQAFPGPSEYHMTRISENTGGAITNMEPGKRGTRTYFDVDDINADAARVKGARRRVG